MGIFCCSHDFRSGPENEVNFSVVDAEDEVSVVDAEDEVSSLDDQGKKANGQENESYDAASEKIIYLKPGPDKNDTHLEHRDEKPEKKDIERHIGDPLEGLQHISPDKPLDPEKAAQKEKVNVALSPEELKAYNEYVKIIEAGLQKLEFPVSGGPKTIEEWWKGYYYYSFWSANQVSRLAMTKSVDLSTGSSTSFDVLGIGGLLTLPGAFFDARSTHAGYEASKKAVKDAKADLLLHLAKQTQLEYVQKCKEELNKQVLSNESDKRVWVHLTEHLTTAHKRLAVEVRDTRRSIESLENKKALRELRTVGFCRDTVLQPVTMTNTGTTSILKIIGTSAQSTWGAIKPVLNVLTPISSVLSALAGAFQITQGSLEIEAHRKKSLLISETKKRFREAAENTSAKLERLEDKEAASKLTSLCKALHHHSEGARHTARVTNRWDRASAWVRTTYGISMLHVGVIAIVLPFLSVVILALSALFLGWIGIRGAILHHRTKRLNKEKLRHQNEYRRIMTLVKHRNDEADWHNPQFLKNPLFALRAARHYLFPKQGEGQDQTESQKILESYLRDMGVPAEAFEDPVALKTNLGFRLFEEGAFHADRRTDTELAIHVVCDGKGDARRLAGAKFLYKLSSESANKEEADKEIQNALLARTETERDTARANLKKLFRKPAKVAEQMPEPAAVPEGGVSNKKEKAGNKKANPFEQAEAGSNRPGNLDAWDKRAKNHGVGIADIEAMLRLDAFAKCESREEWEQAWDTVKDSLELSYPPALIANARSLKLEYRHLATPMFALYEKLQGRSTSDLMRTLKGYHYNAIARDFSRFTPISNEVARIVLQERLSWKKKKNGADAIQGEPKDIADKRKKIANFCSYVAQSKDMVRPGLLSHWVQPAFELLSSQIDNLIQGKPAPSWLVSTICELSLDAKEEDFAKSWKKIKLGLSLTAAPKLGDAIIDAFKSSPKQTKEVVKMLLQHSDVKKHSDEQIKNLKGLSDGQVTYLRNLSDEAVKTWKSFSDEQLKGMEGHADENIKCLRRLTDEEIKCLKNFTDEEIKDLKNLYDKRAKDLLGFWKDNAAKQEVTQSKENREELAHHIEWLLGRRSFAHGTFEWADSDKLSCRDLKTGALVPLRGVRVEEASSTSKRTTTAFHRFAVDRFALTQFEHKLGNCTNPDQIYSLIADFLSEVPAQHNPTVGITAAIKKVIEDHRKKLDSEPSSWHKNEYAKVAALMAIKDIAEAEDFTNRLSLYRTVLGHGIDNAERRTANRDSVLKDLKISCGSASRGMQQSLSSDFMAALPKFGDRAARMLSERYGIKDYLNSTMQSKATGALSHVMKKTKDWSEKAPSFDTLYEHLTSHSLNRSIAKHYLSKMDVSMEVINELQFMPNRRAFIEALSRDLNGRSPDLPAFKLSGSVEQQHDNLALATA